MSSCPFHTTGSYISTIPANERLDETTKRDDILIRLNCGKLDILVLDDIMCNVESDCLTEQRIQCLLEETEVSNTGVTLTCLAYCHPLIAISESGGQH